MKKFVATIALLVCWSGMAFGASKNVIVKSITTVKAYDVVGNSLSCNAVVSEYISWLQTNEPPILVTASGALCDQLSSKGRMVNIDLDSNNTILDVKEFQDSGLE